MSWNTSLLAGPFQVPIFGDRVTDPASGLVSTPITGYRPGVVFVVPVAAITPALDAYADDVPAGVPVLAGEDCQVLTFASEDAAKGPLARYWTEPSTK
jgi:hypothetical protein